MQLFLPNVTKTFLKAELIHDLLLYFKTVGSINPLGVHASALLCGSSPLCQHNPLWHNVQTTTPISNTVYSADYECRRFAIKE